MKFLILALAVVSVCSAQSDEDWQNFQRKYGKTYRSVDEIVNRRAVWESNWRLIKQHNEEYAKGEVSYTLGENEFADMTFQEFSNQRLGLSSNVLREVQENPSQHEMGSARVPDAVDLRTLSIVPAVRNQGSCGSCWAYGAVGTVEGAWALANNVSPPDLSEQQLVDCSKGLSAGYQSNQGCKGGWLEPTYDDIIKSGLQSETSYRYTGIDSTCKYDSNFVVARIRGYVSVNSETKLIDAVANKNLVNVAMYVSNKFQLYKSGIYIPSSAAGDLTTNVNHAVIVVGYDLSQKFLLIKNSWGTSWGESGFFRVQQGIQALNIGKYGVYPTV